MQRQSATVTLCAIRKEVLQLVYKNVTKVSAVVVKLAMQTAGGSVRAERG